MIIKEFFKTPIWIDEKTDFVNSLNKASNKYIKKQKEREKDWIKKWGDFGRSYHSTTLLEDNDFFDLKNYIGEKSKEFLGWQGFDIDLYRIMFSELWVQEFAKKGGGHHSAHIHWNQHVSGFYFLKCSDKTSYPVFHEPRVAARATKLKLKNNVLCHGSEHVHIIPRPGTLIIFPGYMEHEFTVDHGIDPFRFIHFNIQAVPKEMAKDV